jgi:hypothetical protein
MVMLTCGSRDGETMLKDNNSGSMRSQKPSETTNGRTTALTFKATATATISEQSLASTQDGGRCSDTKMDTFQTKEERLLLLAVDLTMRIETL